MPRDLRLGHFLKSTYGCAHFIAALFLQSYFFSFEIPVEGCPYKDEPE